MHYYAWLYRKLKKYFIGDPCKIKYEKSDNYKPLLSTHIQDFIIGKYADIEEKRVTQFRDESIKIDKSKVKKELSAISKIDLAELEIKLKKKLGHLLNIHPKAVTVDELYNAIIKGTPMYAEKMVEMQGKNFIVETLQEQQSAIEYKRLRV